MAADKKYVYTTMNTKEEKSSSKECMVMKM